MGASWSLLGRLGRLGRLLSPLTPPTGLGVSEPLFPFSPLLHLFTSPFPPHFFLLFFDPLQNSQSQYVCVRALHFRDFLGRTLAPSWLPFGCQKSGAQHTLLTLKRPQQPKRPQEASKTPKMTLQVAKMTPQVAKMTPQVAKMTPQVAKLTSKNDPPTTHNITQNTTQHTTPNTTQHNNTEHKITQHTSTLHDKGGELHY